MKRGAQQSRVALVGLAHIKATLHLHDLLMDGSISTDDFVFLSAHVTERANAEMVMGSREAKRHMRRIDRRVIEKMRAENAKVLRTSEGHVRHIYRIK